MPTTYDFPRHAYLTYITRDVVKNIFLISNFSDICNKIIKWASDHAKNPERLFKTMS